MLIYYKEIKIETTVYSDQWKTFLCGFIHHHQVISNRKKLVKMIVSLTTSDHIAKVIDETVISNKNLLPNNIQMSMKNFFLQKKC